MQLTANHSPFGCGSHKQYAAVWCDGDTASEIQQQATMTMTMRREKLRNAEGVGWPIVQ